MEKHHKELKDQISNHEKELAEALENLKLERSHRERLEEELGSQRLEFAQLERVEKELRGATPQIQRDSEVHCCHNGLFHITPTAVNISCSLRLQHCLHLINHITLVINLTMNMIE